MMAGQQDPIAEPLSQIDTIVRENAPAKQFGKRRNHLRKPLPKKLLAEINHLSNEKKKWAYLPYRNQASLQNAKSIENKVRAHYREKPDRKKIVTQWIGRLILNYFYLAFGLVAFWYIATQL